MPNPPADPSAPMGNPGPPRKLPNPNAVRPPVATDSIALKKLAALDLSGAAGDSAVDDLLNFDAEEASKNLPPELARKLGVAQAAESAAGAGAAPGAPTPSGPRTLAEADAEAARVTRPVAPLPRQPMPPAGLARGLSAPAPLPPGLGDIDAGSATLNVPAGRGPKTQGFNVGMTAGTQILREVPADASMGGPGSGVPLGNAVHGESRLSMEISAVVPPGFDPADSASRVLSTTGATATGSKSLVGSVAGALPGVSNGDSLAAHPEALLGQTLGDYRLEKLAGAGGMATVYKAVDTRIGRVAAVKVLLAELAARDPAAHGRLMREAKTSATVVHPNVVMLFQVGRDKNRDYLVMEWVGGGSVQELVAREGPLSADRAVQLMIQACRGVAAAHKVGIIHRDIKPNNLMLSEEGVVKVADFGLAKAEASEHSLTQAGSFLGTPQYMAPELWRGGEATARSDVYALGATLFYLLAGKPPFKGTVYTLVLSHTQRPVPNLRRLRADLLPEVEAIIDRAMAKEAAVRYADAGQMADALEALARSPSISTTRPQLDPKALAALDAEGAPDAPLPNDANSFPASGQVVAVSGSRAPSLLREGGRFNLAIGAVAIVAGIVVGGYVAMKVLKPDTGKDGSIRDAMVRDGVAKDGTAKDGMGTGMMGTGMMGTGMMGTGMMGTTGTKDTPTLRELRVSLNVLPADARMRVLGELPPSAVETGSTVSQAERAFALPPGEHLLLFSREGYVSEIRSVIGAGGESARLDVRLRKAEEAEADTARRSLPELEKRLIAAFAAAPAERTARLQELLLADAARSDEVAALGALLEWLSQYPKAELVLSGGEVTAGQPGRPVRRGGVTSLTLSAEGAANPIRYGVKLPTELVLVRGADRQWRWSAGSWVPLLPTDWSRSRDEVAELVRQLADWSAESYGQHFVDPQQAESARRLSAFLARYAQLRGSAGKPLTVEYTITGVAFSEGFSRAVVRVSTRLTGATPGRPAVELAHELQRGADRRWRVLATQRN